MRYACTKTMALALSAGLLLGTAPSAAQDARPFGDDESIAFAQQLWEALEERNLVGANAFRSYAYTGTEPHGVVLEQIEGSVPVGDRDGITIVKSNFMAENLTREEVMNSSRQEYLDATTVMFKREDGYNPEGANWFWAKYLAGGELDQTPNGIPMAGQVQGCISCHQGAEGGDFVFLHNRFAN